MSILDSMSNAFSGESKKEAKKAVISLDLTGEDIQAAKEKALKSARDAGLDEAAILELSETMDAMAEKLLSMETKKMFGIYNHPAVLGFNTLEQADAALKAITDEFKANPMATNRILLRDSLMSIKAFKDTFEAAQAADKKEQVRFAECCLLMSYYMAGFTRGVGPIEFIKRLAHLYAGAGPGELDFKPVFDSDYEAISDAWLSYKTGEITKKEFDHRISVLKPMQASDGCPCDECREYRKNKK